MPPPGALEALGRSVRDKVVVEFLKLHGITPPKGHASDENDDLDSFAGEATLGGDKLGIVVELLEKQRYNEELDRPANGKTKRRDEWIVAGVDLLGAKSVSSRTRKYPHALPFDLVFGDHADVVVAKLGAKPFEKIAGGKNGYRVGWWFLVDAYLVLVALSTAKKLMWVRVKPLDKETADVRRMKAALAAQNRNIDPRNVSEVAAAARERPTAKWKKRMKEGDSSFTRQGIAAADELIDDYVQRITKATRAKSARDVHSATKKIVVGFNKLNRLHENIVETLEREELCDFIDRVVRATGYRLAEQDITAEWRTW